MIVLPAMLPMQMALMAAVPRMVVGAAPVTVRTDAELALPKLKQEGGVEV